MKKMTSDEIKKTQIGILNYVDGLCKSNDLTYFLAGGTLIGAVRHKGFIPWDDDIDLFMKRGDYEKLIQLLHEKENSKNRFELMSIKTNSDYYYPYIKIVDTSTYIMEKYMEQNPKAGVFVDVFPLDYYSKDPVSPYKKLKPLLLKHRLSSQKEIIPSGNLFKDILKKGVHKVCRTYDSRELAIKIDNLAQCTAHETDKLYIGLSQFGKKDLYCAEWFEYAIELQFEGNYYMAPSGYDLCLRHRYGDYMRLPPENERTSGHHFIAYWR